MMKTEIRHGRISYTAARDDVPSDIDAGLQILQSMIFSWRERVSKLNPPDPALMKRVDEGARFWATATDLANFQGAFGAARSEMSRGIAYMHKIGPQVLKAEAARGLVGPFTPAINSEMERLEADSSVLTQVRKTLLSPINDAVADVIGAVSPAAAVALKSSPWILPAVIAGGAMLFMGRR